MNLYHVHSRPQSRRTYIKRLLVPLLGFVTVIGWPARASAENDLILSVVGSREYQIGETVSVDLEVANLTEPINGLQAFMTYDPAHLLLIDISPEIINGWIEVVEEDDSGDITYVILIFAGSQSSAGPVATLVFRTVGSGVTQITFQGDDPPFIVTKLTTSEFDAILPTKTDSESITIQLCADDATPCEEGVDCNCNGLVDACELVGHDCNGNQVLDECDIAFDSDVDCDGNDILDVCEFEDTDCNANGQLDACELMSGFSSDCNNNAVPDDCDIATGESDDEDDNGRPDECQRIYYVDQSAPGTKTGTRWCDGYMDLQEALDVAFTGDEIRVAQGTYKPDRGTGDREASFHLISGVVVRGGYAGCADPDERDVTRYETVLSGDLNRDDVGDISNRSRIDNSYHILTGSDTAATAVLDGFTISGSQDSGMQIADGEFLTLNCTFRQNGPSECGGGVTHHRGTASFINCLFDRNEASYGGGLCSDGSLLLSSCRFSANSAFYGGGLAVNSAKIQNCEFVDNVGIQGGAVYSFGATAINSRFVRNTAKNGGAWYSDDSVDSFVNSLFHSNRATDNGGGLFSGESYVSIVNCTFASNLAGGRGGGYFYGYDDDDEASLSMANSVFWGNEVQGQSGEREQIYVGENNPTTIEHTVIQGIAEYTQFGEGNIGTNPEFLDLENGDLRLSFRSPSIDAGSNMFLPADTLDLDKDGDTAEPIPFDLEGNARFVDDPGTMDTGVGTAPIVDMGAFEFQPKVPIRATLDIRPGSCPNPFNANSRGVIPIAIIGTTELDVNEIDISTILLSRADGVGKSVPPITDRGSGGSAINDVSALSNGDVCECVESLPDGLDDLLLKFSTSALANSLQLTAMPRSASIELTLTGSLLDGTPFEASDCVTIVGGGRPTK